MVMILDAVSPSTLNFFFDKREPASHAAEDRGDLSYVRIYEAIDKRQLIELKMQDGEVHIGFVTIAGDLDNECVNLVSYASGYRDEKMKALVITSDYSELMFEMKKKKRFFAKMGIKSSNLSIVIRMGDVATARVFYPEVYAEFERTSARSNA